VIDGREAGRFVDPVRRSYDEVFAVAVHQKNGASGETEVGLQDTQDPLEQFILSGEMHHEFAHCTQHRQFYGAVTIASPMIAVHHV
jgi:hypothetical protein